MRSNDGHQWRVILVASFLLAWAAVALAVALAAPELPPGDGRRPRVALVLSGGGARPMLAVGLKCGLLLPSQCRPIDAPPTFGCERPQCDGERPDSVGVPTAIMDPLQPSQFLFRQSKSGR
jgi:hypothetical protein